MANSSTQFGGFLTNVGIAQQANTAALGIPWNITHMLIGDAGGEPSMTPDPTPNPAQTALVRQVHRAQLNGLYQSPSDPAVLVAELVLPPETGGWWIRELALEDANGNFIAVAKPPPSYKPLLVQGSGRTQTIRMHVLFGNTANVSLKIDPSIVLATRDYVDTAILSALNKQDFKHSVQASTTAAITLSGLQTVDGVALQLGARLLVKDQAQGKDNGIYVVSTGSWARAADADASVEVTPGLFVHVEQGTVNGDSVWQLVTDAPITLGTTALAFEMIAGRTGVNAGSYTKVTVDKYGRVVGGTNPSTLGDYGITDAVKRSPFVTLITSGPLDLDVATAFLLSAGDTDRDYQLPPATSANLGVEVVVRRTDNTGNRLRVSASGTDKIKFHTHLRAEGYSFFVLMGAGDYWRLRSDGAGSWVPLSRFDNTSVGRFTFEAAIPQNPGGWARANGSILGRVDWPWLWDYAQQSGLIVAESARTGYEGAWTSGDGTATFRLPDIRGEFMRVLDDSRGVDAGRAPGSRQKGSLVHGDNGDGDNVVYATNALNQKTLLGLDTASYTEYAGATVKFTGSMAASALTDADLITHGGVTRPRNVAYPGRIKLI